MAKKSKSPARGSKPGERRGGRKAGTPNKVTADVRAAVAGIAERKADAVEGWLERVAKRNPGKALDLYLRLIEYHIPKLARTELGGKVNVGGRVILIPAKSASQ